MAQRKPPIVPIPACYEDAVLAAVRGKALQHQDELTLLLQWMGQIDPPVDPRVIVEIGTHQGGTLACWAELTTAAVDPLVVAIDLPLGMGGPTEWGGLPTDATIARNLAFAQRYPHVRTILGNSQERGTVAQLDALLAGRPIDLLFIDGDHTYDGVKADYEMYGPLVRSGGVIAFHDVTCSPERAARESLGVDRFFATLPQERHVFSVGWEWGGIGAVRVP